MPYADYEPLLEHAQNLEDSTPVPEQKLSQYRGILPEGLLEFWARHGNELVFGDGYKQMCNPETFAPMVHEWFRGDPEFDPEKLVVYGFGYSGTLLISDGTKNHIAIHAQSSSFEYGSFNPSPTGENDLDSFLAHALKLGTATPRYIDTHDIFEEAVAKHGPLSQGEMFTWVPALQLATSGNEIEKVDAEVQISILQELGPLKYVADEFIDDGIYIGTNFKRFIGPQE